MAKISKNIKQFRNENKMTQEALAEKINVTRQTVSSWETDRTQPDIEMLEALADTFGVGVEELIYGKKNKVGLEPEKKPDRKIYTIILTIFGTLLTAAGLVIVFMEFWDDLSFAKNFFALLPLFAGFGLTVFALTKKKDSIPWREGSAVAWSAGIAITNALINSLNAVDMGFAPLLLLDSLLLIPVLFITKGIFPFAAFLYGISHSLFQLRANGTAAEMILYTLLLIVLFAVGILYDKKHKTDDVTDVLRFWLLFIAFGFNFVATLCMAFSVRYYQLDFFIAVTFLFFMGVYAIGDRFSPRPLRQVAAVGLMAMSYFAMFGDTGYSFYPAAVFYIVPAVLLLGVIALAVVNRKNLIGDKIKLPILGISLAGVSLFLLTLTWSDGYMLVKAIPAFALAVMFIIKGVNEAKLLIANFGMLNAAAVILILFMSSDADVLVKGIVVLAAGVVLLVINKILIKKFAKETEAKEDA